MSERRTVLAASFPILWFRRHKTDRDCEPAHARGIARLTPASARREQHTRSPARLIGVERRRGDIRSGGKEYSANLTRGKRVFYAKPKREEF